jgi:Fuc2NAc and GlcNAc transferase
MNIESLSNIEFIVVVFFIFCVSWISIFFYTKVAIKVGILATPNNRTSHEISKPSGGGIVFSIIFLLCIFVMWLLRLLSEELMIILGVGGFFATLLGFLDDKNNIRAKNKLILQIILSLFAIFFLEGGPLVSFDIMPEILAVILSILFLVWVINAYNFMDGIDGMASSGAIFSSFLIAITVSLSGNLTDIALLLFLLATIISAFLTFNWPPAKIFMGDAGSVFLGYIFGVLTLYTSINNEVSFFTWMIAFSYFIADTSVTQFLRLILVKKWYLPHRSHAYQNIARITKSHLKPTFGVILYNIFWALPLGIWSVLDPEKALLCVCFAITPGIFIAYFYGPKLSSY